MLLLLSTGFILGSGITMALCYLWFKYKFFKPYEKAVTQALDQSQVNIKEQGKLIKQQDVIIEELNSLLKNRQDIKDRLSDNWKKALK